MNSLIQWLKPTYSWRQCFLYLLGCVLFSFGACCFIEAKLGTDPLDVFALGLQSQLPWVTIGMAQGGFALLMLLVWAAWNRRVPILSPFVTFFFCGSLIDLGRYFKVATILPFGGYPMMFVAVIVCAYASPYIIMSGIGIRAMDLVAITMSEKWKAPFFVWKLTLEALLLAAGWLMGGPVGPGTVAFLAMVGLLIQPMMIANNQLLGITNHGLGRKSVLDEAFENEAPGFEAT